MKKYLGRLPTIDYFNLLNDTGLIEQIIFIERCNPKGFYSVKPTGCRVCVTFGSMLDENKVDFLSMFIQEQTRRKVEKRQQKIREILK